MLVGNPAVGWQGCGIVAQAHDDGRLMRYICGYDKCSQILSLYAYTFYIHA